MNRLDFQQYRFKQVMLVEPFLILFDVYFVFLFKSKMFLLT